jgi:hypothetical protein
MSVIFTKKNKEIFKFLFALQESGITNMWGAVPYAQDMFSEYDKAEVRKITLEWMENYSEISKKMRITVR